MVPAVELHSLDDRISIRDAIMNGRIQEATALINQLHPELLDNDRYLYFHLQVLEEGVTSCHNFKVSAIASDRVD